MTSARLAGPYLPLNFCPQQDRCCKCQVSGFHVAAAGDGSTPVVSGDCSTSVVSGDSFCCLQQDRCCHCQVSGFHLAAAGDGTTTSVAATGECSTPAVVCSDSFCCLHPDCCHLSGCHVAAATDDCSTLAVSGDSYHCCTHCQLSECHAAATTGDPTSPESGDESSHNAAATDLSAPVDKSESFCAAVSDAFCATPDTCCDIAKSDSSVDCKARHTVSGEADAAGRETVSCDADTACNSATSVSISDSLPERCGRSFQDLSHVASASFTATASVSHSVSERGGRSFGDLSRVAPVTAANGASIAGCNVHGFSASRSVLCQYCGAGKVWKKCVLCEYSSKSEITVATTCSQPSNCKDQGKPPEAVCEGQGTELIRADCQTRQGQTMNLDLVREMEEVVSKNAQLSSKDHYHHLRLHDHTDIFEPRDIISSSKTCPDVSESSNADTVCVHSFNNVRSQSLAVQVSFDDGKTESCSIDKTDRCNIDRVTDRCNIDRVTVGSEAIVTENEECMAVNEVLVTENEACMTFDEESVSVNEESMTVNEVCVTANEELMTVNEEHVTANEKCMTVYEANVTDDKASMAVSDSHATADEERTSVTETQTTVDVACVTVSEACVLSSVKCMKCASSVKKAGCIIVHAKSCLHCKTKTTAGNCSCCKRETDHSSSCLHCKRTTGHCSCCFHCKRETGHFSCLHCKRKNDHCPCLHCKRETGHCSCLHCKKKSGHSSCCLHCKRKTDHCSHLYAARADKTQHCKCIQYSDSTANAVRYSDSSNSVKPSANSVNPSANSVNPSANSTKHSPNSVKPSVLDFIRKSRSLDLQRSKRFAKLKKSDSNPEIGRTLLRTYRDSGCQIALHAGAVLCQTHLTHACSEKLSSQLGTVREDGGKKGKKKGSDSDERSKETSSLYEWFTNRFSFQGQGGLGQSTSKNSLNQSTSSSLNEGTSIKDSGDSECAVSKISCRCTFCTEEKECLAMDVPVTYLGFTSTETTLLF